MVAPASKACADRGCVDGPGFEAALCGAVAGDNEAWRELVRSVGPSVLAYARAQGATDAEDTLGDVLSALVRSIRDFQGDLSGFKAWAMRIAHSRIIDERRRATRRPTLLTADPPEQMSYDDPFSEAIGSRWVYDVLDSLPPHQRDILLLRVIGGLSVDQTAAIVGKQPGAVRTAQHRALARLRDTIVVEM